ncbi:MAG: hypothetical protein WBF93_03990, partial [Pirellulales bacterium]
SRVSVAASKSYPIDAKNEGGRLMDQRGFAVGWGTLALINAGIAQGKNRSGLNWFLLSLLLGPIATFVLVVIFEKRLSL